MLNANMFGSRREVIDVITTATTINATATVYTESFELPKVSGADFSLVAKLSSGGTINVKFELEEGLALPATEGASDAGYCVPDDVAAIFTLADANQHIKAFSPDAGAYGRFKITGITTNAATTQVDSLKVVIVTD